MPIPRPGSVTAAAVFAIVFAGLGLIRNCLGSIGSLAQMVQQPAELSRTFVMIDGVLSFVFLGLSLAWLISGIGLLRVSSWARSLAMLLGPVTLVLLVGRLAFELIYKVPVVLPLALEQIQNDPNAAQMTHLAKPLVIVMYVFMALFPLVLPVVVMIALSRQSARYAFIQAGARGPYA